jgi:hypothetical protein
MNNEAPSSDLRRFDSDVWYSTSNKYRHIARVPEGMTAVEALKKYDPEAYQMIQERSENDARFQWLRCSVSRIEHIGCHETLTPQEYQVFRSEGGESA